MIYPYKLLMITVWSLKVSQMYVFKICQKSTNYHQSQSQSVIQYEMSIFMTYMLLIPSVGWLSFPSSPGIRVLQYVQVLSELSSLAVLWFPELACCLLSPLEGWECSKGCHDWETSWWQLQFSIDRWLQGYLYKPRPLASLAIAAKALWLISLSFPATGDCSQDASKVTLKKHQFPQIILW